MALQTLRQTYMEIFKISRHFMLKSRYLTTENDLQPKSTDNASITISFLSRALGTQYNVTSDLLEKHKELYGLKKSDVVKTIETLKKFNYTKNDIISRPMILYVNKLTLLNRRSVLEECGFTVITLPILLKYVTVMNKNVSMLKSHRYIPFDLSVSDRLIGFFTDVHLRFQNDFSETVSLKEIRQIILNAYLVERLGATSADLEKLWKVYGRVRHKNFNSIQRMIHFLITELNFPKDRIIKNAFLLYGDPDNCFKMIKKIKKLGDENFKDILYRRPKILMSSYETIQKTIDNIKMFNIPESAINRCLEVLTLGPDTVLERLKDLNEIEEFQVLTTNPRVLRLIHYQNKARLRLDYLNQLKVKCASLHILSCGSETFAKFARDGTDRTKGRDVIVYLSKLLNKDENDVRKRLTRHPNWCHIPVLHIKHCLDFLLLKKFNYEDIYHNLHLLLYPIKRIEEKLHLMRSGDIYQELNLKRKANDRELLTLILYFIEYEFHFTGDGVWTEHHTQQVENFNNLLPDFPESLQKIYKYGKKPNIEQKTICN